MANSAVVFTDRDVELLKKLVPTAKALRELYARLDTIPLAADQLAEFKKFFQALADGILAVYKSRGRPTELTSDTPKEIQAAHKYILAHVCVAALKKVPKLREVPTSDGTGTRLVFNSDLVTMLLSALGLWERPHNELKYVSKGMLYLHGYFEPDAANKAPEILDRARGYLTDFGQLPADATPPTPARVPKPRTKHTLVPALTDELLPDPAKTLIREGAPGVVDLGGTQAERLERLLEVVRVDRFACYTATQIDIEFPEAEDEPTREFLRRRLAEIERLIADENLLADLPAADELDEPPGSVDEPVPLAPAAGHRIDPDPDGAVMPDALANDVRRLAPDCVTAAGKKPERRFALLMERLRLEGHSAYTQIEIDRNFVGESERRNREFLQARLQAIHQLVVDETLFPPIPAPLPRPPMSRTKRNFLRLVLVLLLLLLAAVLSFLFVRLPYGVVGEWQSSVNERFGWSQPVSAPDEWTWVKSAREWEVPTWIKGRSPQDDVATTTDQKKAAGVATRVTIYCDRLDKALQLYEQSKSYLGNEDGQKLLAELEKRNPTAQSRWTALSSASFGYTADDVVQKREQAKALKAKLDEGKATYRDLNDMFDLTAWCVDKLKIPGYDRTGLSPASGAENPEAWAEGMSKLRTQADAVKK